ncbi:MAG: hypothetical protein AAB116_04035 [Candidatus Poribacteria bacterium]
MSKKYANPPIVEVEEVFLGETLSENVDITNSIEKMLEHLILNNVIIPNPGEISNYLHQYPDIIDLVKFACDETRERFMQPTQLSLELYRDPEIDDNYLTLYVRQEKYDDNVMDIIEEIWPTYSDELASKAGDFLVTTDFNYPR